MAEEVTGIPIGSAPHARGTLVAVQRYGGRRRVSPACAGNTSASAYITAFTPGQPRMRGEHDDGQWIQDGDDGSAPHARGTLFSKATDSKPFFR